MRSYPPSEADFEHQRAVRKTVLASRRLVPIEELARRAADIASKGYPVFPCDSRKAPIVKGGHGHLDATDHPDQAYKLFMAHRQAVMIGVPMGVRIMLVCIDVDPDGKIWLRNNWRRLGDTLIHRTPRGGVHIFYQLPKPPWPIIECRKTCDGEPLLAEGVDVKGEGGAVIWAGSPGYTVINDAPSAEMPLWLKRRLTRKPKPQKDDHMQLHKGVKGFEGALAKLANTREGNRNEYLFWTSCRAGELVRDRVIQEHEALKALIQAARAAKLDEKEARLTAESGLKTGMRS